MESNRDCAKRVGKIQKEWLKDPKNKEYDIYICDKLNKLIIEGLKEHGENTDSIKFKRVIHLTEGEVVYRYAFTLKDGSVLTHGFFPRFLEKEPGVFLNFAIYKLEKRREWKLKQLEGK